MGKEGGFLEIRRRNPGYRPVEQRLKDFKAVEIPLTEAEVREQSARCMDCGIPFCHGCGCPLANIIPEFNDLVYKGRWKDALALLLTTNCFPEFTGRICPAPCETSCVLGINDDPVTIRQVELAIIEQAFARGFMEPRPPDPRHGERVAVVGSGPSGLAVAQVLNQSGYHVTVFENAARPGGILRYGIPDFKLEKWVVERRVKLMEDEGVRFETGVEVGVDISHRYLKERFDAIVLTGGAREPRDLKVPGRDLEGIHYAMTYLVQQNRRLAGETVPAAQAISAEGRNVVVIGGGDTGADCIGTALRQGARKVYQFEILPKPPPTRSPRTPWPQWPDVLRESSSHKEGGERRWSVTTHEFLGKNGKLVGLRCGEVEWTTENGRAVPKDKAGSEFKVEADLVLLAMGFVGPGRNLLVEQLGIQLDSRGFIKRTADNMTSDAGTFVAGDMTQGASLVVRAIADGEACAAGVIRYLERRRDRVAGS